MERLLNKLKGYRTIIVSAITSIAGLLVSFGVLDSGLAERIGANSDEFYGGVLVILGAVYAILRKATNTPLGDSE